MVVEGGESQPFIPDDEETEDEEPGEGTEPEEFGITSATATMEGDDIVLTVVAYGDVAALEVDHSHGKYGKHYIEGVIDLPEFNIYASEDNPWGDAEGDDTNLQQAIQAGVVATYDAATKTFVFTIEGTGAAKQVIDASAGMIEYYLAVHHSDGRHSHTMSGSDRVTALVQ